MSKEYSFFRATITVYLLWCILFIPFPFHLFPFQQGVTDFIFGKLIALTSSTVFDRPLKNTLVYSDSVSMYVLVLLLFILSLLINFLLLRLQWWKKFGSRILYFIYLVCCYYLVMMLLKYGLDKIFKTQFYLPEPNTLYTPLGQIDKDLLYWTSMGTSRFYNIFAGSLEVLAASLIFFRKTRMTGLLLAAIILVQVVAINFGFDISVKLFSLLLLSMVLYLLYPYRHRLVSILFNDKNILPATNTDTSKIIYHPFKYVLIKCMIIGLILFEAFYPNIKANNFNDDTVARPLLHGAYEVQQMISGIDTIDKEDSPLKKIFIHRNGYIIFQNREDGMQDFNLEIDKAESIFILTNYQKQKTLIPFSFNPLDSLLTLQYVKEGKEFTVITKSLDWAELPVLKNTFHWTVD